MVIPRSSSWVRSSLMANPAPKKRGRPPGKSVPFSANVNFNEAEAIFLEFLRKSKRISLSSAIRQCILVAMRLKEAK